MRKLRQRACSFAVLALLMLNGCASLLDRSPACVIDEASRGDAAIQRFERDLNRVGAAASGEPYARVQPVFDQLDKQISAVNLAAAAQPAHCHLVYLDEVARLKTVRARGEQYVAQLRQHLFDTGVADAKGKPVGAIVGGLRVELVRVEDAGQRLTLRFNNADRKARRALITRTAAPATANKGGQREPFRLVDQRGRSYPLQAVVPEHTRAAPLRIAPRGAGEVTLRFAGPYPQDATRLTLLLEPALLLATPPRGKAAPVALAVPPEWKSAPARPVFVAEPTVQTRSPSADQRSLVTGG